MNTVKRQWILSAAAMAILLLAAQAGAQTQAAGRPPTGIWTIGVAGGAAASRSGSATHAPAANSSGQDSGASSWSAGSGSFKTQNAMPETAQGAVGAAVGDVAGSAGASSWVAGRDSFASKVQPGGIWRDSAGLPRAATSGATGNSSGHGRAPAVGWNFPEEISAFTIEPVPAPRNLAAGKAHPAGSRGASKAFPAGSLGRIGAVPSPTGLLNRTNRLQRATIGLGAKNEHLGLGSTKQTPSFLAPSTRNATGNASGGGIASHAPRK